MKRIGTGLAFILYPLLSGIAFAVHPNLLSLEIGGEVSAKVAEFREPLNAGVCFCMRRTG